MKLEQKIAIIYSFIGIASGFLSNFLNSLLYAVILPLAVYSISFIILVRLSKRKILWLLSNSFITFLLVWLVVWIFLYNL